MCHTGVTRIVQLLLDVISEPRYCVELYLYIYLNKIILVLPEYGIRKHPVNLHCFLSPLSCQLVLNLVLIDNCLAAPNGLQPGKQNQRSFHSSLLEMRV